MKNIILIICLILLCTVISAQEIPVYELQEIITLKIGSGTGEVGYDKDYAAGGGYPGPTFYTFSPGGNLYIFDHRNKRINVYNSTFNFIKTINPATEIAYDYFIWATIDEKENLACFLDMKGLYKLDNTGKIIYSIPIKFLSRSVSKFYNFFPIGDDLLIYNDGAAKEKLMLFDNEGLRIAKDKTETLLHENTIAAKDLLHIENDNEQQFESFLKENNIIINSNKLLTTDFKKHRKFFNSLLQINKGNSNIEKVGDSKDDTIFELLGITSFKGFDINGNSCWFCTDNIEYNIFFIVILSNKGELIDFFKPDLIEKGAVTISPTGDVYFIKTNEEGCKIYKTIRQ